MLSLILRFRNNYLVKQGLAEGHELKEQQVFLFWVDGSWSENRGPT